MKRLYVFSTLVSSAANLHIITLMITCQTFHNKKSPQGSRFTMTLMEVLLCCIVSRFVTHSQAVSIQTWNMITFGCNCFVWQNFDPCVASHQPTIFLKKLFLYSIYFHKKRQSAIPHLYDNQINNIKR